MRPVETGRAAVAAVILAAGASSRFGSPKPLVRVGSRTMLQVAVDAATGAGLAPVLAVLSPEVPAPATVTVVRNARPERGMSRSLQLGLAAIAPDVEAAIVLLGDQPTVDVALLHRLLGARGATPVVAVRAGGLVGPPVLLERGAFELAGGLSGDVGLRRLLRTEARLVTPVDLPEPIPDVDEPADLEAVTEPCPGCGAWFLPQAIDETHPYIGASPACWAAYGELLAREFGDATYGRVHRHSADVYAVQHPGIDDRRQRQSVALHLIALHRWLEEGREPRQLNAETQRLAAEARDWPWLEPPAGYPMTVLDVLDARSGSEHVDLVRRWAETAWRAWSAHHATVRRWAAEAG
jgi:CTP:molybdopterin cytidylyltransferase MocA